MSISITSASKRKIRDRLESRRTSLLSRYKDALERADEELASPARDLADAAAAQWDARILSMMTDVDVCTLENVVGAIQRLDAGIYGRCAACGERIEPARLAALPEAAECIDCVRFAEETPPRWVMSVGANR
jgi:RNA polymerase-binding transcription factor DksA